MYFNNYGWNGILYETENENVQAKHDLLSLM
jgi:hypothetical protein